MKKIMTTLNHNLLIAKLGLMDLIQKLAIT